LLKSVLTVPLTLPANSPRNSMRAASPTFAYTVRLGARLHVLNLQAVSRAQS
jgi:hypothetical protein